MLQSANEARIADLEEIVHSAVVVEHEEGAEAVADLGASLELEDSSGERVNFHLVGTHEADVLENRISDESPLGKTLVGKRSGDQVEWNGIDYNVINVSYE